MLNKFHNFGMFLLNFVFTLYEFGGHYMLWQCMSTRASKYIANAHHKPHKQRYVGWIQPIKGWECWYRGRVWEWWGPIDFKLWSRDSKLSSHTPQNHKLHAFSHSHHKRNSKPSHTPAHNIKKHETRKEGDKLTVYVCIMVDSLVVNKAVLVEAVVDIKCHLKAI